MKTFIGFVALSLSAALLAFSGCSKKPSQEELNRLDESRAAAEAAERKLSELREERQALESNLDEKKKELSDLENERESLKSQLGE